MIKGQLGLVKVPWGRRVALPRGPVCVCKLVQRTEDARVPSATSAVTSVEEAWASVGSKVFLCK